MSHRTAVDLGLDPLLTDEFEGQKSIWRNRPGYKPMFFITIAMIFTFVVMLPPTQGMLDMVKMEQPVGYQLASGAKTITDTVNERLRPEAFAAARNVAAGHPVKSESPAVGSHNKIPPLLTHYQVAQMSKVTVCVLFLAAFLWGTEAIPLGATDIIVGVLLYLFAILPINDISKAYMSDAVFFIFGIFAVAVGVAKTALDKRIALILLSRIKSAKGFAFLFLPMLALSAGFLSGHALAALLIPVLMGVYKVTCKMYGVKRDRALAIFLILGVCFAVNNGGPGSPAAGGRNAIMVGFLADYGMPITFLEWMKTGIPFVLVMSWVIGLYMYLRLKPRLQVKGVNPGQVVRGEVANMPKLRGHEAIMAVILVLLIISWVLVGEHAGLGGSTLCAVIAMFVFRIITWEDVQNGVAFDVVGLYAAACAMGVALKFTGGALWLASTVIEMLPDFLTKGDGLVIGLSFLTGTMANFMSGGATVAALGPIVLPMATLAKVSAWKVGLITAFSASFANFLVVGTPTNAICFGLAKDPENGERLLDVMDFLKFGLPVTILAWLVLWLWTVLGYWQFLPWK